MVTLQPGRIAVGLALAALLAGCLDPGPNLNSRPGPVVVALAGEAPEGVTCGAPAPELERGTVIHEGEPEDYEHDDLRVEAASFVITDALEVRRQPTSVWLGFESAQTQAGVRGDTGDMDFVAAMLVTRDGTLVGASTVDVERGRVEIPNEQDDSERWPESQEFGPLFCDGRGELALSQVGDGVYTTHMVVQAVDADGAPLITWVNSDGTGGDIEYYGDDEYWKSMFDRPAAPARND